MITFWPDPRSKTVGGLLCTVASPRSLIPNVRPRSRFARDQRQEGEGKDCVRLHDVLRFVGLVTLYQVGWDAPVSRRRYTPGASQSTAAVVDGVIPPPATWLRALPRQHPRRLARVSGRAWRAVRPCGTRPCDRQRGYRTALGADLARAQHWNQGRSGCRPRNSLPSRQNLRSRSTEYGCPFRRAS